VGADSAEEWEVVVLVDSEAVEWEAAAWVVEVADDIIQSSPHAPREEKPQHQGRRVR